MFEYVRVIQKALGDVANVEHAKLMKAYMKAQFEFLGVPTPLRRAELKPIIKQLKGIDASTILQLVDELWQLNEREYQYVAIDILTANFRQFSSSHLEQLLLLAQKKSWWDSVDGLAGVIGDIVRTQLPTNKKAIVSMDNALLHRNFWVRRIAILHQLGWRQQTDVERLFRYALNQAAEKEFFIRKAIAWSLRDYAWHDPELIRGFLDEHVQFFSALTLREARKNL